MPGLVPTDVGTGPHTPKILSPLAGTRPGAAQPRRSLGIVFFPILSPIVLSPLAGTRPGVAKRRRSLGVLFACLYNGRARDKQLSFV
jgi:hypothetical protein